MANLILLLTMRGFGIREAIAVCQSHSQWAFLFALQQEEESC